MSSRPIALVVLLALVLAACGGMVAEETPTSTVAQPQPESTTTTTVPAPTTAPVVAGIRDVPGAYPSVQEAADASAPGDEIVVAAGTPIPFLDITTPDVLIRSAEQPTPTGSTDFVSERFEVAVDRGVVFAEAAVASGMKELALDIYRPVGDDTVNRPALVAIHGGGFVTGTRRDLVVSAVCRSLASRGQVCISIDYRLAFDEPPGQGPPVVVAIEAAVEDAVAAVAWVRANADDLGVDPDRVSIGGSSAGAITALLVGFTNDGAPVHRVVDLWGGMYAEVDQVAAGGPPVLIVHGTLDETVEFEQAVQLMDALSVAGVPFVAYPFPGAGHGIGPGMSFDDDEMLEILAAFLGS